MRKEYFWKLAAFESGLLKTHLHLLEGGHGVVDGIDGLALHRLVELEPCLSSPSLEGDDEEEEKGRGGGTWRGRGGH